MVIEVTPDMCDAASEVLGEHYLGEGVYDLGDPVLTAMYRAMREVALRSHAPIPQPVTKAWGVMEDGRFVPLPKQPMLDAELGPPPFDVTLPHGEVRHIIEDPGTPGQRK